MPDKITKTLAIVGGSNSLLLRGYSSQIVPLLATVGLDIQVRNHAVGANTSMRGLYTVGNHDFSDVDAVVIEYFINDFTFFSTSGADVWTATFEGMVRYLRKAYPRLHIIPLVLGRRDTRFHAREAQMLAALERIATHYDLTIADFNGNFRRALKDDKVIFDSYKDGSHYRVPGVSYQIAAFLAQHVVATLLPSRAVADVLPAPMSAHPFESVANLDMDASCPGDLPRRMFENSRYTENSVALGAGQHVEMDLPGRPLLLCYVSEAASCDLVCDDGTNAIRLHTLHKEVAPRGAYPFLLRSAVILGKDWSQASGPVRLRLTALRSDAPYALREGLDVTAAYNMQPNTQAGDQAVFLNALMIDL